MSQKFTYYVNDQNNSNERRAEMEAQGVQLRDDAWENIGRPFYEIALECEVDDSGKVKIIGVKPSK